MPVASNPGAGQTSYMIELGSPDCTVTVVWALRRTTLTSLPCRSHQRFNNLIDIGNRRNHNNRSNPI